MFEHVAMAPEDPILGLTEAFAKDPNPDKINLSVGVYQDNEGRTPILESVRQAAARLLRSETTKSYLGMAGTPEYARAVQELVLGADHEAVATGRAVTAHTPGGTGALRVAGDFFKQTFPAARVWLSQPTWPNHPNVFAAAGLETKTYSYFNADRHELAFDALIKDLQAIPAGDIVVLHACCHNPTGVDLTAQQWGQIADLIYDRGLLPLLDFAYQGFASGLAEDAAGVRAVCRPGTELILCSSFSKNFGLYRERVGALTFVAANRATAERVQSQVKQCIRANYSNPPAHGGAVVTMVLTDPALSAVWQQEVGTMRDRISAVRKLLVSTLVAKGVSRDFSFITRQRGMFSFAGLTPEQVDLLRAKYSIYAVRSGRINVAGITDKNIDRLGSAIADVLKAA
ncbi:MAG: aromatic amino acid aminotransferase [Planctomycetes bacterium RBG_16_64_10]|nr:MAG: aromatic amino acid aminotransferase [Planctomycetes bacterium RBG_16_64_10]